VAANQGGAFVVSNTLEPARGSQNGAEGRRRPSLFSLILAALVTGLACGLFFGEYLAGLKIVGRIYVGLLQMTVLPYIVFALVASIGRLSLAEGKRLAVIAISVLALLWGIGCLTVALMSLALPFRPTGAFFSTGLLEPQEGVDLLSLFIPSNPFGSLANNAAPAVVVFCILFGVALGRIEQKDDLLAQFDVVVKTLFRVNHFVVSLSPIGIFAITAAAAGTLSLEEFGRLQAYLLTFALGVLLLTFWVLPMLVAAFTPFKFKDVLAISRNALVTVFVVQSLFVVIPMLAEGIRQLAEKYHDKGIETYANPDFVIPLAYPFPHLGKVLTLIFVPFAAWFYGIYMPLSDFPLFLATGLVLSFGKVTTTIPFLLAMQELPVDIFQLFLVSSVFAGGLSDLAGCMFLLTFTALTTCAMSGLLRVNQAKLVALVVVTALVGGAMIVSTRAVLSLSAAGTHSKQEVLGSMHLKLRRVPAWISPEGWPNLVPLRPGQSRLERIRERGVIRIGFQPDDLPFSFFNARDELVGLDIEMAHNLADDLGVRIEFVPFTNTTLRAQLAADHFDIVMSGLPATTRRAEALYLSEPYLDLTLALVVPDHLADEFVDRDAIRKRGAFGLGIPAGSFFAREINQGFPEIEVVPLETERQFFENPPKEMDALLTSAEGGSAWTLIYPGYTIVNPRSRPIKVPMTYAYGGPDPRFEGFLEHWIRLKRKDGTIDGLYDYWVLGQGARVKGPRWSIIRDVLGWVP
jgi:Na+/H+-dicarboxylate symporter/ABC-type amino acid transport substrate-binding protein